ncbi:hypothetical protein [Haloprofundus halobius]|uniref:hypothetical protein n=1 Tax=Haloprofundus halobius TaxID=2876194 RepID=UPI001CCFC164|nr:hypothetical protein [Haloprofundus halobius]
MDRRALLAVVAAGLSGCVADPPLASADGSNESRNREPPENADPDAQRWISIASTDEIPEEAELEIDAEVVEPNVTPEKTARVEVTTTNRGAARKLSHREEMCSIFNRDRGVSVADGLVLHRPSSAEWMDRVEGKWSPDRPAGEPRGYASYACGQKEYDESASVTSVYDVWDDYRTWGYMRPGTYRFETHVATYPPDAELGDESDVEFTWGLELKVRKP